VIEHVGSWDQQLQMAIEVMRVAKSWFVTTPNRWYPFEFHMRLPFVTWLPFHGYLGAGRIVSYNHIQHKYQFCNPRRSDLRLLSARQMKQLFPDSLLIKQKVTFMPETLVVIGGEILSCK
jgi:hypothetical protein